MPIKGSAWGSPLVVLAALHLFGGEHAVGTDPQLELLNPRPRATGLPKTE